MQQHMLIVPETVVHVAHYDDGTLPALRRRAIFQRTPILPFTNSQALPVPSFYSPYVKLRTTAVCYEIRILYTSALSFEVPVIF